MAFAVKLGILVVKSVTKPFAKRIKNTQDKDLQHFCRRVGQAQNKMITLVNLRMSGIKAKKVKELPDEQALSLGAELVSEGVILGISGTLLALEYWRRDVVAEKKKLKHQKEKAERREKKRQELEARFQPLYDRISHLENEIETLKSKQERGSITPQKDTNSNSWWTSWLIFEKT